MLGEIMGRRSVGSGEHEKGGIGGWEVGEHAKVWKARLSAVSW